MASCLEKVELVDRVVAWITYLHSVQCCDIVVVVGTLTSGKAGHGWEIATYPYLIA